MYEPVTEKEERVISIEISDQMAKHKIVDLILERSQQYYHSYNSKTCPRLLDGFYKSTVEGFTPPAQHLVKVTGTKLEFCFGTQTYEGPKLEYGQVLYVK